MEEQISVKSELVVREIEQKDAGRFLELCRQIDRETKNMLLEPQERTTTLEDQQAFIKKVRATPNQAILTAEVGGDLVGFLVVMGGEFNRNQHTASVVMGVLKSWWRQGIGASLLDSVRQWAVENRVHRLELTVRADNTGALSLYKSKGFFEEGRRRHSLCVDGNYVDEFYMAMLV